MLTKLLTALFGSRNQRTLQRHQQQVDRINSLEKDMQALSDQALSGKTLEFRKRLQEGTATLEQLLPEAFAVVREASHRVLNLRHFDVQLLGGIVLTTRSIAEMRTGEGKTLTATLPAYLNALTQKGVHIVTVNDYLAQRDAETNRPLFEFLGLTVGVNLPNLSPEAKRAAYAADITYGTNNEFGFDYLRDNMAFSTEHRVQRALHYALVDEVDSILIDEARTPLIISGASEDTSELYVQVDRLIPQLRPQEKEDSDTFQGTGDFYIEAKSKQIFLTERGQERIEQLLAECGLLGPGEGLYTPGQLRLVHHILSALRAHHLYHRDVDYIVKDREIIIVDEHTGRTMTGRRWSDGLHQAIEAKEGVPIQNENQTLASITFQNYFRLYDQLAGMTGTADTEAFEFRQIYQLDTVVIPTNQPMIRVDLPDVIYLSHGEKLDAIIEDIKDCVTRKQPVLVGTVSIEKSEELAKRLKAAQLPYRVLNAKFHEQEAKIIAQAGLPGAVTIATNMAGRGTDIILGGNYKAALEALPENTSPDVREQVMSDWKHRHDLVVAAGGLHVIGTERHESRRIDNQLRGRSGRQGDPGSSRFYLSMEDSLMKVFGSERMVGLMKRMGMQPGEAITHRWVSSSIEKAQKRVENRNFDIRKQLLEFDDVANEQRKVVYAQRNLLLETRDISKVVQSIRTEYFEQLIKNYLPGSLPSKDWSVGELIAVLKEQFALQPPLNIWIEETPKIEVLTHRLLEFIEANYAEKTERIGAPILMQVERGILLQTLDLYWKEHLTAIDHLRQGIHLRGYAQKDPKQEYKRESFELFSSMLVHFKEEALSILFKLTPPPAGDANGLKVVTAGSETISEPSRNMSCPCGSGIKYKYCHGRIE